MKLGIFLNVLIQLFTIASPVVADESVEAMMARVEEALDPDAEGDVLSREWDVPQDIWIQRHRAYAFQWFALALTLVVLYLFYRRRGRSIERS